MSEEEIPATVDLMGVLPQVTLYDAWSEEPIIACRFDWDKDGKDVAPVSGSVVSPMVNHLAHRILCELLSTRPILPKPLVQDYYKEKNSVLVKVDDYLIAMCRDVYEKFYGKISTEEEALIKKRADYLTNQYVKENMEEEK